MLGFMYSMYPLQVPDELKQQADKRIRALTSGAVHDIVLVNVSFTI